MINAVLLVGNSLALSQYLPSIQYTVYTTATIHKRCLKNRTIVKIAIVLVMWRQLKIR